MTDYTELKEIFDRLEEQPSRKIGYKVKPKRILGFDTETVQGKAVLIASSDGRFLFPQNFEQIAHFLTQKTYTRTLNFYWNLDYDFFAIVKHIPPELLEILYDCHGVIVDNYFIKWIPRKYFSITRIGTKYTAKFYDLWQFYRSSLNEASRKYLGDAKEEIDVTNIAQYLEKAEMRQKLIKYCLKDAILTQKLGELLQAKLNNIGISFDKPYSCGNLSQRFFFKGRETLGFKKTEWNLYALYCYYGGRFEVLKRGFFRKVYQYDINSAYPFYISKLVDPNKGEWIKTRDIDYSADYGFAKISIKYYENDLISPIPFRTDSMVIYPNFSETTEYYLTFPELKTAERLGLEFDVLDSWAFYGTGEPLFPQIAEIYEQRKRAKAEGDKALELVLKILMNSLYGKFAERKAKLKASLKPAEGSKEINLGDCKFYVLESNKPGILFNPVLAAYITALTRVQLVQTCMHHFDDIIMFATDSILTTKPFIPESEKLGDWKLEMSGEAVVLMTGVYTIRNEKQKKTRFRGFPMKEEFDLFELLEENRNQDKIEIEFEKVVKLGEVISFHNIYDFNDLNEFITEIKEISCYSDEKRDWLGQPTSFGQLLEEQFESVPKTIIGPSLEMHKKRKAGGYEKNIYDWLRTRELEEIAWLIEKTGHI
jgi:hypothetical protein